MGPGLRPGAGSMRGRAAPSLRGGSPRTAAKEEGKEIRVDEALRSAKLKARLILQVHDELIVECPLAEAKEASAILKREMEQVAKLRVPLVVEANEGSSWYEAK